MNQTQSSIFTVDATGKPCPMPLLMLKRALKSTSPQQTICVRASDPHSEIDILRYCEIHHLTCHIIQSSENEYCYMVEKNA